VETYPEANKHPPQNLRRALTTVSYPDPHGNGIWTLWVGANIHIVPSTGRVFAGHAYIYGWTGFPRRGDPHTTAAQVVQIQNLPDNLGHMPYNTCPTFAPAVQPIPPAGSDFDTEQDTEHSMNEVSENSAFTKPTTPPPVAAPIELKTPDSSSSKYNVPVTKHYTFNETGNIMIASTIDGSQQITESAQDLFQEVAVFFAALTKSLASTPRHGATEPYDSTDYYTLYDYAPIEAIVQKSGMFVTVNREDLSYTKTGTSTTFNTELIASILGFAATDGADVAALSEVLRSMGKHATLSWSKTNSYDKIGHLTFVCEYLMGMPLVNVEYYYIDEDSVKHVVHLGPCVNGKSVTTHLSIHKDTFLFVPPEWLKKYSGDLASVADTKEFQLLVQELESYITGAPVVLAIKSGNTEITDGALTDGTKYVIDGMNLGNSD